MNTPLNRALWFALRLDKISSDGRAPICIFYSLNGVRVRYATDEKVNPGFWDSNERKAIFIKKEDRKSLFPDIAAKDFLDKSEIETLNANLTLLAETVKQIENNYLHKEQPFSSQMVIARLKELKKNNIAKYVKIEEPDGLVFNFIDKYIIDHEATREPGSLSVYRSVKNHLKAYQDTTGHRVTFETIDYNFFNRFQTFLINRTKTDKAGNISPMLNNTTIAKALSTLKTFLGYARREGINVNSGYKDFVIKKEKLEVIALDQEEFDAILNLDLSNDKRLAKVADLFCFACATGLRYSDVAQLRREHINDGIISLKVKKTKTDLTVPLNSISASILDKYQDLHKPLPIASNQHLNREIKELCKLAGIDRPIEIIRFSGKKRMVIVKPKYEFIHYHTARKTFITLSLEKGMNAQEIMSISGHVDFRSFARYVDVTEKRKKAVMLKAWGEISPLKIVS